jgi:hypothetical protein
MNAEFRISDFTIRWFFILTFICIKIPQIIDLAGFAFYRSGVTRNRTTQGTGLRAKADS